MCITDEAVETICRIAIPPEATQDLPALPKFKKIERAREWKCLGSDREIKLENPQNLGDLTTVKISRKRSEFKGACKFGDRDSVDAFLELRPYRDGNYDLIRSEINVGVQALPELKTTSAQTSWLTHVISGSGPSISNVSTSQSPCHPKNKRNTSNQKAWKTSCEAFP
jgi:hypothetical protein